MPLDFSAATTGGVAVVLAAALSGIATFGKEWFHLRRQREEDETELELERIRTDDRRDERLARVLLTRLETYESQLENMRRELDRTKNELRDTQDELNLMSRAHGECQHRLDGLERTLRELTNRAKENEGENG